MFGKWVFCFSAGFLLIGVLIAMIFDPGGGYWDFSLLGAQNLFHLLAILPLGGLWLVTRTTTLRLRTLSARRAASPEP